MATETGGPGGRWSAEPAGRWAGDHQANRVWVLSISVAVLLIVVFAYALANVTMRLQRHITARQQWSRDTRFLGQIYESLSRAAANNDGLAYDLLRPLAWNGTLSLQQDAATMPSREQPQHLALLRTMQNCLPQSLPAFKAQAPDVADACQRLLAAPASSAATVP